MKKRALVLVMLTLLFCAKKSSGQIDWEHLQVKDIIGKVMRVEKGFAPKFTLGRTPVDQISKVAEILGLKKNDEVNRLFNTFRTGRTIYKVAAYTGGAIVVYGLVRKLENSVKNKEGNAALYSGISAVGSGIIVKLLTKGASYKAVDIFNGIAVKKIKDIFSIAPATSAAGIGLFVKL